MAKKRSVLVTGASTGIGLGATKILIRNGFHVFGSVRTSADGDRLVQQFGEDFSALLMDVTDEAAVRQCATQVEALLGRDTLAGLVNNAGIAVSGPLLFLPIEQMRHQLEVNLIAPLRVTQIFAPLLGTDSSRTGPPGRIVNISSVGGRMGAPFVGPYVASKHALEGLSESLRRELILYGIDVIIVAPGYVATPIWDKAEAIDRSLYQNTDYAAALDRFGKYFIAEGRKGFPPERVGEVVLKALTAARPKVRYAVVPQRFRNWTLPMLLPKRLLDRMITKQLGMGRSTTKPVGSRVPN